MDVEERARVLKVISEIQEDTSAINVQLGHVRENTNIVDNESLFIQKAPPKLVTELSNMGYHLAVTENGLQVR